MQEEENKMSAGQPVVPDVIDDVKLVEHEAPAHTLQQHGSMDLKASTVEERDVERDIEKELRENSLTKDNEALDEVTDKQDEVEKGTTETKPATRPSLDEGEVSNALTEKALSDNERLSESAIKENDKNEKKPVTRLSLDEGETSDDPTEKALSDNESLSEPTAKKEVEKATIETKPVARSSLDEGETSDDLTEKALSDNESLTEPASKEEAEHSMPQDDSERSKLPNDDGDKGSISEHTIEAENGGVKTQAEPKHDSEQPPLEQTQTLETNHATPQVEPSQETVENDEPTTPASPKHNVQDEEPVPVRSLKLETDHTVPQAEQSRDTNDDDSAASTEAELTSSPPPQTPTTPDDVRISTASMASVPLSETDMSYDHLSPEQVEDFLATPRNNGTGHTRRPSSLEILANSWEPKRQSTLFDFNQPESLATTPTLVQHDTMGVTHSVISTDSGNRTPPRQSQSSEDEANEVDWKSLERHEWQEKSDKEIPEGAEDDSTAFLLARLEQENALLTSDPKAATHKHVKKGRGRGQSRPPSMAHLKKLVAQTGAPSIRYSMAPNMDMPEEPPPMTELEFWTALVQDYPSTAARLPTLTTSKIRAGIPPPLRGVVWASMAGARERSLEEAYDRLLDEKSPYEGIINKDVGRSFPGVDLFRDAGGEGQKMLGRVLKCFSLHDKDIGYCQGLGFLVGPLLMNMGEREAFCTLVRLMDHYSLQPSFLPSLSGLHMRIYQFSALLKQLYPELSDHLVNMGIEPAYLSQWFLSCFAVTCPLPMLFRMYDVIFAEGANETVMRVALAIMRRNEQKLLASTEFEEVMHLLLGRTVFDSYGCNADELVDDFTSLDDVITHARLAELEKEFEMQTNEAVGEKAGFLPDVQAAASRFLGRLWSPSHSSNKSTTTLSPTTAEKERGGILRRSASKQSISTLNDSNDGGSSGVVSLVSTAPTETDIDVTRESIADTMSLRSKSESLRTRSATPQPSLSKEDRDMHSQIEDLLTALSEMQREHAQLAAMLQKEREDRNDDHRVVRQLVDRIQNGEQEDTSTVEERRRTLPPPPRNPTHNRQLSHPAKPQTGPKQELNDLLERVNNRLQVNARFSTSLETKAQLRNTISRTRDQLAAEERRSRDLVATISTMHSDNDELRSEVTELRTRVSDEFKERQKLEHTIRELQAQARVIERRELLSRTESGNDVPTHSSDNRRVSFQPTNSNSAASGLRELKLGRRESSSSMQSLRTARSASNNRQPSPSSPTSGTASTTFNKRSSSLGLPLTSEPEPTAEENLLLELVNAKTSEAQARQEVDELRRSLAVQRRKQDEEKRVQEEALQKALTEAQTAKAEAQAWRAAESKTVSDKGIESLPPTPNDDGGVSPSGPDTPEKEARPAVATAASTVGGWFWGRRTASTNQAKVPTP
ncbi:hypothetical protein Q7P37_005725 [Cladosporium fusiforme]